MKKTLPTNDAKLLVFDLETTSLDANRGHIICAAAKWVGKPTVMTWRIDEGKNFGKSPESFYNDRHIVKGLIPLVEAADAVIAYYGSGFDVPYLNTRAFANKVLPPVPFTLIDPWKTASGKLKLARNTMDAVSTLVGGRPKTHLPWGDWLKAQFGCHKSISKLLKYNINDIRVLEDVYLELRPIIAHHPYVGRIVSGGGAAGRCPACGGAHSTSHDTRRTRSFEVFRNRCKRCHTAFETGRRKIR